MTKEEKEYCEQLENRSYWISDDELIVKLFQQTKELREENERLQSISTYRYQWGRENVNLKKQLQEKKREAKVLVNTINEVWNEENGSVQMHTPIAWYRVLRLININS